MANIVVGFMIISILGLSIAKIVIEKRKGSKCIGCPHGSPANPKCGCDS